MSDKKLNNEDFIQIVADGLKEHCEEWNYNWIDSLKLNSSIKNFRKLFFKVTHLYYVSFDDDLYNVTFDKNKDVAYIKRCGEGFDKRDFDAIVDIEKIIKLLVGDNDDTQS